MPFSSDKQRRYLYKFKPSIAKKFSKDASRGVRGVIAKKLT